MKRLLKGRLASTVVGARETGEEVVCDLEVEAAVDEGDGVGAGDVYGCAELAVHEGFGGAEVGGGAGEVGEHDLVGRWMLRLRLSVGG